MLESASNTWRNSSSPCVASGLSLSGPDSSLSSAKLSLNVRTSPPMRKRSSALSASPSERPLRTISARTPSVPILSSLSIARMTVPASAGDAPALIASPDSSLRWLTSTL